MAPIPSIRLRGGHTAFRLADKGHVQVRAKARVKTPADQSWHLARFSLWTILNGMLAKWPIAVVRGSFLRGCGSDPKDQF